MQLTFSFVVQELVPNKYRGYVVAIQFILSFPFACFGPVMARSFVLHTEQGWRWCYYLNMITCGLSLLLFFFFYHPPNYGLLHQGQSMRRELKRLDYVGLVLYCCGLIMLLLGISWGGKIHPWNSPTVIGLLVGGITTIVVYFVYGKHVQVRTWVVSILTFHFRNISTLQASACPCPHQDAQEQELHRPLRDWFGGNDGLQQHERSMAADDRRFVHH